MASASLPAPSPHGAATVPASLEAFFWFNPTLGNEQTESKKILYCYPPSTTMNKQKDYVGLCEGVHGFTSELSPVTPVSVIRSDERVYALKQCEKNLWLVAVVNNPYHTVATGGAKSGVSTSLVYHSDDLGDDSLSSMLSLCYQSYRLFNNTIENQIKSAKNGSKNYDFIRASIELYMRYYLPQLNIGRCHLLLPLELTGFRFLPVDANCFFTVKYLLNNVLLNFGNVAGGLVLYDEELIYSGLSIDDTLAIYHCHTALTPAFESYWAIREESFHSPLADTDANTDSDTESAGVNVSEIPNSYYEILGVKRKGSTPEPEIPRDGEKFGDFLNALNTNTNGKGKKRGVASKETGANTHTNAGASPDGVKLRMNGFMTGPYRQPLSVNSSSLLCVSGDYQSLSSPMWSAPLPFTLIDRACVNSPVIYLSSTKEGKKQRLVAYHRHRITVMLVVNDDIDTHTNNDSGSASSGQIKNRPSLQFYDDLEKLMHSTIKKLATQLADMNTGAGNGASAGLQSPPVSTRTRSLSNSSQSSTTAELDSALASSYKFLYFNTLNYAINSQFNPHSLTPTILKTLRSIHDDLQHNEKEIVVRLRNEGWVCGGRAAETRREWLLVLDDRVPTLSDVEREIATLQRTVFNRVYLE